MRGQQGGGAVFRGEALGQRLAGDRRGPQGGGRPFGPKRRQQEQLWVGGPDGAGDVVGNHGQQDGADIPLHVATTHWQVPWTGPPRPRGYFAVSRLFSSTWTTVGRNVLASSAETAA